MSAIGNEMKQKEPLLKEFLVSFENRDKLQSWLRDADSLETIDLLASLLEPGQVSKLLRNDNLSAYTARANIQTFGIEYRDGQGEEAVRGYCKIVQLLLEIINSNALDVLQMKEFYEEAINLILARQGKPEEHVTISEMSECNTFLEKLFDETPKYGDEHVNAWKYKLLRISADWKQPGLDAASKIKVCEMHCLYFGKFVHQALFEMIIQGRNNVGKNLLEFLKSFESKEDLHNWLTMKETCSTVDLLFFVLPAAKIQELINKSDKYHAFICEKLSLSHTLKEFVLSSQKLAEHLYQI
ncbi:hypothetical protein Ciccas_011912, partial [Cichlidogyrus casuarinus]